MSLPHVLLGLLSRGPASGWDLRTRLSREPSLGWEAELSQIYPALKRLLRGGFVATRRRRSSKGPPRREYRLTPAGRRELVSWLAEPPSLPRPRDAMLARLAFLERRDPPQREETLRAWAVLVAQALRRAAPGVTAARRRWRALLETELAWAESELVALSARRAQADAAGAAGSLGVPAGASPPPASGAATAPGARASRPAGESVTPSRTARVPGASARPTRPRS